MSLPEGQAGEGARGPCDAAVRMAYVSVRQRLGCAMAVAVGLVRTRVRVGMCLRLQTDCCLGCAVHHAQHHLRVRLCAYVSAASSSWPGLHSSRCITSVAQTLFRVYNADRTLGYPVLL